MAQSPIDISEANLVQVDNFEPLTFHGFDLTPDTAVLSMSFYPDFILIHPDFIQTKLGQMPSPKLFWT